MKLMYNLVAVKPFPADEIRIGNGKVLYLDTRFEEYLNAKTAGRVMAVPDKLKYDPMSSVSLEWDTDMELMVGDTVVYNYLAVKSAIEAGLVMEDGTVVIPYDKIYAAVRDGKVVCVNGFIVVEPEQEVVESFLDVPDSTKQLSKQIGRVLYAGSPNRGYKIEQLINGYTGPDTPVKAGDRVIFNWNDAIPVQPNAELRGEIDRKVLYRMQHKDVHALVDDNANVIA